MRVFKDYSILSPHQQGRIRESNSVENRDASLLKEIDKKYGVPHIEQALNTVSDTFRSVDSNVESPPKVATERALCYAFALQRKLKKLGAPLGARSTVAEKTSIQKLGKEVAALISELRCRLQRFDDEGAKDKASQHEVVAGQPQGPCEGAVDDDEEALEEPVPENATGSSLSEQQIQAMTAKLTSLKATMKGMVEEKNSLADKLNDAHKALDDMKQKNQGLVDRVTELMNSLNDRDSSIESLQVHLRDMEKDTEGLHNDLASELEEVTAEVGKLSADLKTKTESISNLENVIRDASKKYEQETASLLEQNEELAGKLGRTEQELQDVSSEKCQLQSQVTGLESDLESKTLHVEDLTKTLKESEASRIDVETQRADVVEQLQETKVQLEATAVERDELRVEVSNMSSTNAALEDEVTQLKSAHTCEREQLAKEKETHQQQIQAMTAKVTLLKAELKIRVDESARNKARSRVRELLGIPPTALYRGHPSTTGKGENRCVAVGPWCEGDYAYDANGVCIHHPIRDGHQIVFLGNHQVKPGSKMIEGRLFEPVESTHRLFPGSFVDHDGVCFQPVFENDIPGTPYSPLKIVNNEDDDVIMQADNENGPYDMHDTEKAIESKTADEERGNEAFQGDETVRDEAVRDEAVRDEAAQGGESVDTAVQGGESVVETAQDNDSVDKAAAQDDDSVDEAAAQDDDSAASQDSTWTMAHGLTGNFPTAKNKILADGRRALYTLRWWVPEDRTIKLVKYVRPEEYESARLLFVEAIALARTASKTEDWTTVEDFKANFKNLPQVEQDQLMGIGRDALDRAEVVYEEELVGTSTPGFQVYLHLGPKTQPYTNDKIITSVGRLTQHKLQACGTKLFELVCKLCGGNSAYHIKQGIGNLSKNGPVKEYLQKKVQDYAKDLKDQ